MDFLFNLPEPQAVLPVQQTETILGASLPEPPKPSKLAVEQTETIAGPALPEPPKPSK